MRDPKFDVENDGGHMVWKQPAKRVDDARYDWDGFYQEVLRFMAAQKQPASDGTELQDHMRHWCLLTWRRCPTEALLHEKLERVSRG